MKHIRIALALFHMTCSLFIQGACPLGELNEIAGSPFSAGSSPFSIAYSPLISGNLLAAAPNRNDDTVSVYTVNTATGFFSPAAGSPFPTGSLPTIIAFSPQVFGGLFAAITNSFDATISIYQVDITTGTFTQISGSPMSTSGSTPFGIAYSPLIEGTTLFAAITDSATNTITMYKVNVATGAFTQIGLPISVGAIPANVAFSSLVDGNLFVATANSDSNDISIFQVNTTTGMLTSVAGSPFPSGSAPIGIAFSPIVNGNLFVAVDNGPPNEMSAFRVDTITGALTSVPGSPFGTAPVPRNVVFSSLAGGNLFAAVPNNVSNAVSVYQINLDTGTFTPVLNSPFAAGNFPFDIAFSPLIPGGLFAATANFNSNNVSVFKVNTIIPTITTPSFYIKKGMSVTINATITGGTPPFEVVWQDGFTQITNNFSVSRTVTPSVTTNYFIQTVTDADDCIAGPSNIVTIGVIPCPI